VLSRNLFEQALLQTELFPSILPDLPPPDIVNLFVAWWLISTKNYLKGKAIPLQAWTDPEGSKRLKLPDFKTFGT
jgi:hypothetical protein